MTKRKLVLNTEVEDKDESEPLEKRQKTLRDFQFKYVAQQERRTKMKQEFGVEGLISKA